MGEIGRVGGGSRTRGYGNQPQMNADKRSRAKPNQRQETTTDDTDDTDVEKGGTWNGERESETVGEAVSNAKTNRENAKGRKYERVGVSLMRLESERW